MAHSRTNSLHERLPVELRKQVEEDLVEQPPGRETYAKVYEHYQLDMHNVSLKALEHYGGYLRALARNHWIREMGDALVGEDLSPRIEGVIRSRLYEAVISGETSIDELRRAAMAEKHLRQTKIMTEMWEAKKRELKTEVQKLAAKEGGTTVNAQQVSDLIDRVMRGEDVRG